MVECQVGGWLGGFESRSIPGLEEEVASKDLGLILEVLGARVW